VLPPAIPAEPDVARDPIRGSSLLLSGRVLALGVTYLAQVPHGALTCPSEDYGAWTYSLSIVMLARERRGAWPGPRESHASSPSIGSSGATK